MTVPPNVKYEETFLRLEREARKQDVGLWQKEGARVAEKNGQEWRLRWENQGKCQSARGSNLSYTDEPSI